MKISVVTWMKKFASNSVDFVRKAKNGRLKLQGDITVRDLRTHERKTDKK
jgi:hypothetical protein